ncbi:PepSY domain-containing protein [Mucilaginibacter sp. HMF5004]|uniref:PepSY domain-containing protein n=1 Tax=Mucilaginibacter rivuli TaxID=2857527 RepID=UPI001C5DCDD9|nr:PepSY domain-containing protein [Mucilaginibacter rivuli]MBW4889403.1 PepSY domain-containing protein [Mucilaginibacter rivuli]
MFRKNIYKWHRTCSLIIAVPVLLWAISGFMHPIMTNFRPAVKTQSIPTETPGAGSIQLSLQQVLKQNKIDSIYSVRLVHIDTNWFYQVKTGRNYGLEYISTKNGNILTKGDWLYAQYIARIFLEGPPKKEKKMAQMEMPADTPMPTIDCCGEAANTVLNTKTGTPIENASLITHFNDEYKSIYCLLPVYEVSFKRDDHIRLYVETGLDRFAVAVDKNRAAFTTFFDLVHTWGWINFLGRGRLFIEIFFTSLAFITSLMGIYIFFTTKSKRIEGNKLVSSRRNHRYTAIVASVFTLMFTFSGCYHAFSKLNIQPKEMQCVTNSFAVSDISFDLNKLQSIVKKPVSNIGLTRLNGITYWQVYLKSDKNQSNSKDLMKDMGAAAAAVVYVNADNSSVLNNGDQLYAQHLAAQLSGYGKQDIQSTQLITRFTDEYNFTDKRLPVWKVTYPFNHKQRLYIETSTGVLAKTTNDSELYEGYSFALFHKHHYMDFAGKTTRDVSTMVGAALQVLMVLIGSILYFRWRRRKLKQADQ